MSWFGNGLELKDPLRSWHVYIFIRCVLNCEIGESKHLLLDWLYLLAFILCKCHYTRVKKIVLVIVKQLAVEYESNAIIVKVDTDDEYEFARDMQVNCNLQLMFSFHESHLNISM